MTENATTRSVVPSVRYIRFVSAISFAGGAIGRVGLGAFGILADSAWPIWFVLGYAAFRLAIGLTVHRKLARVKRYWAMPIGMAIGVVAAQLLTAALAPFALGAAVAGFVVWLFAYANPRCAA
jgi:hypothetical protein